MFKSKLRTITFYHACGTISASRSYLAEHMAKFKMSIQLNLCTFYKHFSQTNENTKRRDCRIPRISSYTREFKQIATAGATTAIVVEKVWGEYVAVARQNSTLSNAKYK